MADSIGDYKYRGTGLDANEKRAGGKKFRDYIEKYNISSLSDLSILEELVYLELLADKIKTNIAEKQEKALKDGKEFNVPKFLIDAMNSNFEQILQIRDKLGMFENKDGSDGFAYIQKLKEKFKRWEAENQGSRTMVCPHCSKMMLLRIKPEVWEAQKHPFFKDKILANKHLIRLYKAGKLSAEDVALILETSPAYTEWLVRRWNDIDKDSAIDPQKT
jgi:ribosomal protein L37AE/L43A